jgi:hypothetical protein
MIISLEIILQFCLNLVLIIVLLVIHHMPEFNATVMMRFIVVVQASYPIVMVIALINAGMTVLIIVAQIRVVLITLCIQLVRYQLLMVDVTPLLQPLILNLLLPLTLPNPRVWSPALT